MLIFNGAVIDLLWTSNESIQELEKNYIPDLLSMMARKNVCNILDLDMAHQIYGFSKHSASKDDLVLKLDFPDLESDDRKSRAKRFYNYLDENRVTTSNII